MEEKKLLVTIFPYFIDESDEVWLLLCRTVKLKILNGFGGKVDEDEEPEEGALRELREEMRIDTLKDLITCAGVVKDGLKEIYIYLYRMDERLDPDPNPDEISEAGWYRLSERPSYTKDMLSGDDLVLEEVAATLSGGRVEPFFIDKTGDQLLDEQTRDIFS